MAHQLHCSFPSLNLCFSLHNLDQAIKLNKLPLKHQLLSWKHVTSSFVDAYTIWTKVWIRIQFMIFPREPQQASPNPFVFKLKTALESKSYHQLDVFKWRSLGSQAHLLVLLNDVHYHLWNPRLRAGTSHQVRGACPASQPEQFRTGNVCWCSHTQGHCGTLHPLQTAALMVTVAEHTMSDTDRNKAVLLILNKKLGA